MKAPIVVLALFAALARAAAAPSDDESIHACPGASGDVVYQLGPCVEAKRTPSPPPPRKPSAQARTAPPLSRRARSVPAAKAPASSVRADGPIRRVVDPSAFTSDPRWGSPRRTLDTFIAAMTAGDLAAARACLTPGALADYGARVDAGTPESLRSSVAGYTGFVLEGQVGPYWAIRALRPNAKPKWYFFERVPDGTWRISAL